MTYEEAAKCRDAVSDAVIAREIRKHGLFETVEDAKADWLASTGRPMCSVADLLAWLGY